MYVRNAPLIIPANIVKKHHARIHFWSVIPRRKLVLVIEYQLKCYNSVFFLPFLLNWSHPILFKRERHHSAWTKVWFKLRYLASCGIKNNLLFPHILYIHLEFKLLRCIVFNDTVLASWHCVKSVQIRSYFWSVFSRIRTEYGEIRSVNETKYSKMDQVKFVEDSL